MIEKMKGYKTFLWALWPNIAIVLALAGFDAQAIQDFIVSNWELVIVVYTAGVALLRSITNTPSGIFSRGGKS